MEFKKKDVGPFRAGKKSEYPPEGQNCVVFHTASGIFVSSDGYCVIVLVRDVWSYMKVSGCFLFCFPVVMSFWTNEDQCLVNTRCSLYALTNCQTAAPSTSPPPLQPKRRLQ